MCTLSQTPHTVTHRCLGKSTHTLVGPQPLMISCSPHQSHLLLASTLSYLASSLPPCFLPPLLLSSCQWQPPLPPFFPHTVAGPTCSIEHQGQIIPPVRAEVVKELDHLFWAQALHFIPADKILSTAPSQLHPITHRQHRQNWLNTAGLQSWGKCKGAHHHALHSCIAPSSS
jgi:hypothetical protein